ncbi:MAG: VWA domain-containing protein [Candidatus Margulisiibacteriota bacterium]
MNSTKAIMLVLDTSQSMKAQDFQPKDRFNGARKVALDFIAGNKQAQIGLVVFAKDAFTCRPLTLDHQNLIKLINTLNIGIAGEETNLETAILTAGNRLKNIKMRSKSIILLTDGDHNDQDFAIIKAGQIIKKLGIKIYVLGFGSKDGVRIMINDPKRGLVYAIKSDKTMLISKINERTLKELAQITGGGYFRAQNEYELLLGFNKLKNQEINYFKQQQKIQYQNYVSIFVGLALILFVLEIILNYIIFIRVP